MGFLSDVLNRIAGLPGLQDTFIFENVEEFGPLLDYWHYDRKAVFITSVKLLLLTLIPHYTESAQYVFYHTAYGLSMSVRTRRLSDQSTTNMSLKA